MDYTTQIFYLGPFFKLCGQIYKHFMLVIYNSRGAYMSSHYDSWVLNYERKV